MKFGLLGRTLGHSFSPRIHNALGNTNYELFEREPSQLQEFFANPELQGINITFPYKVNALEACDVVDPRAERIGCVNTMVRKDGKWHGYNTDYDGFVFTLKHAGIDVSGKECIILGDGASSATVHVALEDLGAKSITHLSRKTAPLYTDAPNYYETAQIIINCTPIGMYPHNPASLIDIMQFSKLEGVVDLIYNPRRTVLLLQAEMMDIPHCDGLPFLVAQGVEAANHFQGESFGTKEIEQILRDMRREKENIILIGMPGVGKTTVGKAIGKEMGRTCIDVDQELAKEIGDISTYITEQGEAAFREKEAEMIRKAMVTRTYGASSIEHIQVILGKSVAYVSTLLAPWDIAPGMVIAKELGLHYSTVDGKEVDFLVPNKKTTGVICSKDIADEIIAAFK